jgi:hypothetical protein
MFTSVVPGARPGTMPGTEWTRQFGWFSWALRLRLRAGLRQCEKKFLLFPRHLPFSVRCAPRDRAGLLSPVPFKRDWIVERP